MRFKGVWLGLLLLGYSCVVSADKFTANQKYLFVQYAGQASIEYNPLTKSHELHLRELSPIVTFFSERPNRRSGKMNLSQFLDLWNKKKKGLQNFSQDPPNADFSGTRSGILSGQEINCAIELGVPTYHSESKTLSYIIKPLNMHIKLKKMNLHHVSLFIDEVCLACW